MTYVGTNSLLSRDYFANAVTLLLTFEVYAKGTGTKARGSESIVSYFIYYFHFRFRFLFSHLYLSFLFPLCFGAHLLDIVHPHDYVLVNMEEIATFDTETMDRFWSEAMKKSTTPQKQQQQHSNLSDVETLRDASQSNNNANRTASVNNNSDSITMNSSSSSQPQTNDNFYEQLQQPHPIENEHENTIKRQTPYPPSEFIRPITSSSANNTNSANTTDLSGSHEASLMLNASLLASHHPHHSYGHSHGQHDVLGISLEQFIYACLLIESAKEIEDSSADYSRYADAA
jgi:hypothetical protein